mgnify:CR=1 FL=1
MRVLMYLAALAAFLFAGLAFAVGRSDIQLGMGANAALTGIALLGIASVLGAVKGVGK